MNPGIALAGPPVEGLVSIVVVNFNYGRFLGHAVSSALDQGRERVEVIVVDDGSTDDSRSVIASFGNDIVPVLKTNGGMASALNAGFRQCRGDVVIFLDADDLLLPGAAASARAALSDPGVVKAHWYMREVDVEGRETGEIVPRYPLRGGDMLELAAQQGPFAAQGAPTSGNAWSRSFLEQVLPMPEPGFVRHADSYLNTIAPVCGRVSVVNEPQGLYRVHASNDYAGRPKLEQLQRNLAMYHARSRLLASWLRRRGLEVQPAYWKQGNSRYESLETRVATLRMIELIVPEGDTIVLVDRMAFGSGQVIPGRPVVRICPSYPLRDGRRDTQAVIRDIEKLRGQGASFLAFVPPVIWWLRGYRGLKRWLEESYECELSTADLVIFNLRGGS